MMPWRKWNVIIVLVLANYIVFGFIAAFVFPVRTPAPLSHTAQPTFTPGTRPPQRVGTLSYDFLTPSPIVRATGTSTRTRTPTATETPSDTTPTSTTAPTAATVVSTTTPAAPPITSTPSGMATLPGLLVATAP